MSEHTVQVRNGAPAGGLHALPFRHGLGWRGGLVEVRDTGHAERSSRARACVSPVAYPPPTIRILNQAENGGWLPVTWVRLRIVPGPHQGQYAHDREDAAL